MGFVVPGVRIRIGQAIVAEDSVYPDRKLALPGGLSQRKLQGIEGKDPSVWNGCDLDSTPSTGRGRGR